ncbi:putative transcriptional adapter 2, partial [Lasiosphaeria ovina]
AISQLQEWRTNRIGDLRSGEKYEQEKALRIQKAIPLGSMDRERLATTQRNKQQPAPDPPSGAALLVAPELPIRSAANPNGTNGESSNSGKPESLVNGNHVNGGSVVVANGATPAKPKFSPAPLQGIQPMPLSQENAPDLHLLTPDEAKLCEVLRVQPRPYLMIKEQILKEAVKGNGSLKKKQAREICHLDSQKGGRIFDFMVNAGWVIKA